MYLKESMYSVFEDK